MLDHRTAIFRQINKERAAAHHDALRQNLSHRSCCDDAGHRRPQP